MPLTLRLDANALAQRDLRGLKGDTHKVACVSALLWTYRTTTDLHRMLGLCGLATCSGKAFTATDVKTAVGELRADGLLVDDPKRPSALRLVDALRALLYRELLEGHPGDILARLIGEMDGFASLLGRPSYYWPSSSLPGTIAYVRAKLFAGAPQQELFDLRNRVSQSFSWSNILLEAVFSAFDGSSFARVDAEWRSQLAYQALASLCRFWADDFDPVADWAIEQLHGDPQSLSEDLRTVLGDLALQRGDRALLERALAGVDSGLADALHAAQQVCDGQWAAGQAAFESALKRRRSEIGGSKHLLPETYSWLYPLALLAQQTPKHLEAARKFCIGESGRREPSAYDPWGAWVHAIDVRLGNTALLRNVFSPSSNLHPVPGLEVLWTLLLAAWLGSEARSANDKETLASAWRAPLDALRRRLVESRMTVLLRFLEGAEAVLAGREPPSDFFVAGAGQHWREILTALQSLADERVSAESSGESTRLRWAIDIGKDGRLTAITPLEQKRGLRGWSRARPISLGKIAATAHLPPRDAKVARAIHPISGYSNRYRLDLATAISALLGHSYVVLAWAPEQLVDFSESAPELELIRQGDQFVMRIEPPLRRHEDPPAPYHALTADEKREAEALRLITLVQDGPQRLRLVRFNPAQRQAAQLVSGRFAIPAGEASAQPELEKTLRVLSAHFQIHADSAQATRQVDSDSRLRAELSPIGEHLSLRLVVAPLGDEGPRLVPASGRIHLMAVLGNETIGTVRDLKAERQHLDALLDALPFLDDGNATCEWLIEDPEQALSVVESLPHLTPVAVVEWPKGKSLRVVTLDTRQLGVRVSADRGWFRLSGEARIDEGLVLQLGNLLSAARTKSRFVPIGEGVYAALTRALKQKLSDLDAVLEDDAKGSKVSAAAAAWLDDILDGTESETGRDFRRAIEQLRSAQAFEAQTPRTLQAVLRPYQEDGYQWAMRLACAGMGGCLADDMGLGKTLQALAVLLERASGGPALVIAPTSVCGNWSAEARRFAPTLNVQIYGEASDSERDGLLAAAAAQDLLIVSYTLLQLAQERFAERRWHTVIADEAQAIKNAAAKRSQAVFELNADFRLALTGTPVENRLADLWSIMRFANPGLLGSAHRFNERFAGPIERNRDREAQHILKRLIGAFVLRRTKAEVLQELPARTELILAVGPGAAEAAHYEALRRLAAQEIDTTLQSGPETPIRFNILAQLTRLRRAACDPRLSSPEVAIVGAKVQAFTELASELTANGHKALVFSQFVDFLALLREPLDAAGVRYQYLDGATPAAERNRRIAAFQSGDGDLFLISLKAGGFGLNLTAADYVVITDPWWNPAAEDQAMGRAHRIGQARPVTVYRLVSKGTVEERIVDLHHEKRALAESLLSEGEASAIPSTEDLLALIRGN